MVDLKNRLSSMSKNPELTMTAEPPKPEPKIPENRQKAGIFPEFFRRMKRVTGLGEDVKTTGELPPEPEMMTARNSLATGGVKGPVDPISKDEFYVGVAALMQFGGVATKLKSLPIKPEEEEDARLAVDALYDTAVDVPWLHFLVEPGNKWVQRALCIGVFVKGKYEVVRLEIAGRKLASKEQEPSAQAELGV